MKQLNLTIMDKSHKKMTDLKIYFRLKNNSNALEFFINRISEAVDRKDPWVTKWLMSRHWEEEREAEAERKAERESEE